MKNNNCNPKKETKAGRIIGVVLIVVGGILTGVLVYLVSKLQPLPRLLIAGPSILSIGLGMFVFPGGNLTYKELNRLGSKKGAQQLWADAPISHRLVWILTGLIGIAMSFKIMIDQGFLNAL